MTEAEWLRCREPVSMLESLGWKANDRKLRLVAVACCRRAWPGISVASGRIAVEVAERHADGAASDEELRKAKSDARQAADEVDPIWQAPTDWDDPQRYDAEAVCYLTSACACAAYPSGLVLSGALEATTDLVLGAAMLSRHPGGRTTEESAFADLVRDIFANPFLPAPAVDPAWLVTNSGIMQQLARAAYDERHLPDGTLDSQRLAVLADALEDAGCGDAELLGHLRGSGVHVRGCWAVDLILGKS
jgi:hypothetical protein